MRSTYTISHTVNHHSSLVQRYTNIAVFLAVCCIVLCRSVWMRRKIKSRFRIDNGVRCVKTYLIFSARCNIYISRLCYDVSVRPSVCDGSALWSRCMPGRGEGSSCTMLATARPSCSYFEPATVRTYSIPPSSALAASSLRPSTAPTSRQLK